LTNPEVIAVDQHSQDNRAVVTNDTTAIWLPQREYQIADERSTNPNYFLAVFNISDVEQTIHYEWKDLGLKDASYKVRDLWKHKAAGSASSPTVTLRPHASVLYRLTAKD
jgi:alpha-galactosidase